MDVQVKEKANTLKNTTTQHLLALKQQMIAHGLPEETLKQLDGTINKVNNTGED